MYFPFLRGKQFELIALREFAGQISDPNSVKPIIEPVRKKTSTYSKTLDVLQQKNINFTIIINPSVGDNINNIEYVCTELLPNLSYNNFQLGVLLNSNTDLNNITRYLIDNNFSDIPLIIILDSSYDGNIDELLEFTNKHTIKYITLNSQTGRRRFIRILKGKSDGFISISDPYNKLSRNKDYASETDEFFSEEHLYFNDEGFIGYSDYLTIGDQYSDKGYSPYAVAIHLTYKADENSFRVHHFVSNSNDDTSDIAGKFSEALDKLIPFIDKKGIDTNASNTFRKLHNDEKYPGLGTVKKLSILNHLELVNEYFSEL